MTQLFHLREEVGGAELKSLRVCVDRGRLFGDEEWAEESPWLAWNHNHPADTELVGDHAVSR